MSEIIDKFLLLFIETNIDSEVKQWFSGKFLKYQLLTVGAKIPST